MPNVALGPKIRISMFNVVSSQSCSARPHVADSGCPIDAGGWSYYGKPGS